MLEGEEVNDTVIWQGRKIIKPGELAWVIFETGAGHAGDKRGFSWYDLWVKRFQYEIIL
ncbi:hypothetical protein [Chitinophaga parva]|uniref:hypothetical protein n=1 Tax=Chitinophaga parva TaxID=2169414 RepID=UPI001402D811|nr:hypothetical protein [Chitinophaga parva]